MYKIPGAGTQVASKSFNTLHFNADTWLRGYKFSHICFLFKLMAAVYTAKIDNGLHVNPESKEALISLGKLSQYSSDL